jgi:hypothetical protein
MAALAEAEGELDERFEYDAPRFYDFDEGSPAGAQPDQWFDTDGPKGGWRRRPQPPCTRRGRLCADWVHALG